MASRMENIQAQIIVFNTMLAMMPQLSPDKVFRSQEHMKEVSNAIIKYLERLEEELEVLEEEQEENNDSSDKI